MADFSELERLLRTSWPNPTMLAQELYVVLNQLFGSLSNATTPQTATQQPGVTEPALTINGNGTEPSFVVNPSPGGPSITFSAGGIDLGGLPLFNVGVPPPYLGSTALDGAPLGPFPAVPPQMAGLPPLTPGGQGQQPSGSGGIPGKVVSGTGATYQFQPLDGTAPFTVVQGQIDPSATLPAGTFAVATLSGNTFYINAAVWL